MTCGFKQPCRHTAGSHGGCDGDHSESRENCRGVAVYFVISTPVVALALAVHHLGLQPVIKHRRKAEIFKPNRVLRVGATGLAQLASGRATCLKAPPHGAYHGVTTPYQPKPAPRTFWATYCFLVHFQWWKACASGNSTPAVRRPATFLLPAMDLNDHRLYTTPLAMGFWPTMWYFGPSWQYKVHVHTKGVTSTAG